MSAPLPKFVDHRKHAEDELTLEGVIPLVRFERITGLLAGSDGDVTVRLAFSRGRKGRTTVTGEASVTVTLTCQRCLKDFPLPVSVEVDNILVRTEEDLDDLIESENGLICEEPTVYLTALVEDDLIVSLPMIPRHDEAAFCDASDQVAASEPVKETTHRPFAGLADLKAEILGGNASADSIEDGKASE